MRFIAACASVAFLMNAPAQVNSQDICVTGRVKVRCDQDDCFKNPPNGQISVLVARTNPTLKVPVVDGLFIFHLPKNHDDGFVEVTIRDEKFEFGPASPSPLKLDQRGMILDERIVPFPKGFE